MYQSGDCHNKTIILLLAIRHSYTLDCGGHLLASWDFCGVCGCYSEQFSNHSTSCLQVVMNSLHVTSN